MTTPTNPLSYNAYIQQIGVMAVALTQNVGGVYEFVDPPLQEIVPQMLAYSELRIQRDLDFLQAKSFNSYTLTQGNNLLQIPINDFLILETLELTQVSGGTVVNGTPLIPVSKEFIQNCYGSLTKAKQPRFFAMYGDDFGSGGNSNINVLLGPPPNYAYTIRATGVVRLPSLYQFATVGPADTSYTLISQWFPDLLMQASMIYISEFQRNFSSTGDDTAMPMSYEKQYQILRIGALSEENRKKFLGSAYSSYSTPVSATPTR